MTGSSSPPQWQMRPPYLNPQQREANGQPFEKKLEATCHCGKVQYWLSRDKPLASKYCHCVDCQAMHGESLQLFFVMLCFISCVLPTRPI